MRCQDETYGNHSKKSRNKYARQGAGELMLVHICQGCGHISTNRIAGDDDSYAILELFKRSFELEPAMLEHIQCAGIQLLGIEDMHMVMIALFGVNYGDKEQIYELANC